MATFERKENLNAEEMDLYTKAMAVYRPKLKPTGETIKETYLDGSITQVVVAGSWTPYGCMRDCGDHYIVARYSRYDRVSKDLQTVTLDVDDI